MEIGEKKCKTIIIIKTRFVIVIDDHEASPSSSDCMTLRSNTRSLVTGVNAAIDIGSHIACEGTEFERLVNV